MIGIVDPTRLIERLCAEPRENEWLEFKCSEFDPDRVGQYISGLANSAMLRDEHHAYLVFGVENNTHKIVGTTVRLKDAKVGNEPFENWVVRKLDPRLTINILPFEYKGIHAEILAIEPAYQRPVRFDGEAYIRVDSQLKKLKDFPERERSIWLIASRFVFERGVAVAHCSAKSLFEKFEIPTLLKLLGKAALSKTATLEYLCKEDLIIDDLQGGYDVTNLCALLCSKDISAHPTIAPKAPRVVTYKGKSKLEATGDDVGRRGYAITFPRFLAYLMERSPFTEEMRHGIRRTIYSYPEVAVRELVANALIHQDFTIEAGRPLVEIYSDRLQITNPGVPLVDVGRFIDTPSKTRNVKLAAFMRRAGLCEERGSGVDRAIKAIEEDGLPPPMFRISENSTVVTLFNERAFSELTKEDRVRGCYQHACLKTESGDAMSNGSLRIRFKLSTRQYPQISEVISETIAAGLVRPLSEDQANRTARYVPYWY